MERLFILLFYICFCIGTCLSELKSTIFYLSTKPTSSSGKQALRYGFHKTDDCKSFEKAFLCIQKCIDLNYDVAHADKNCQCTCYIKQDRAKYKPVSAATKTRYRSGAPKTSVPPWAQPKKENQTINDGSDTSNEAATLENVGTEKLETDEAMKPTAETEYKITEEGTVETIATDNTLFTIAAGSTISGTESHTANNNQSPDSTTTEFVSMSTTETSVATG